MKRFVLTFVFFSFLYGAAFCIGRFRLFDFLDQKEDVKTYLDLGFRPAEYVLEEKPFVCVVVGYNNGAFVERTLHSIFSQSYTNFRLIYVDDASNDGSLSLVQDIIETSPHKERATILQHEESLGELASLCEAIQECGDQEIVVWIEDSDWLAHEWALSSLNRYYADPELWLTYGQYREFPDYKLGVSSPFSYKEWKEKGFRGHKFVSSHLKTFYAGLFKRIDPSDFTCQGAFLTAGIEYAVMIPLLELAEHHFHYVPEVLYIANRQISLIQDEELEQKAYRYIRSLASYYPLSHFIENEAPYE